MMKLLTILFGFLARVFPTMIFDLTTLLSDDQAIVATANSTNYIDTGAVGTPYGAAAALAKDIGKGNRIPLLVQVTEDFTLLTSLQVILQCDGDSAFGSAVDVLSQTILLADLVAGKQVNFDYVPKGVNERYFRLRYVVTGTNPDAGKITAGIVMGVQDNV